MSWLTWHFVLGVITWGCIAIGALCLLSSTAFLVACLIKAVVGRLRRWPRRDPQHTVASQSVPDDEWKKIVALIKQAGAAE